MSKKVSNNDAENEKNENTEAGLLSHPSYEELIEKLNECEKKSDEHWERVLRMQAEKENMVRRHEKDLASAHKFALEKFVDALIPILDSLELAGTSVPPHLREQNQAVIEGIELTLKMFLNALEKFGVKQVNPISKPFDPEFEQAISMQEDDTVKPGTVISVLQKGYTLNNRLIRPALVVVSKAKE